MNNIIIESWKHFMEIADLLNIGKNGKFAYAFRGHANKKWALIPSLTRALKDKGVNENTAINLEVQMLNEFRSEAHLFLNHNEFSKTDDIISWWCIMQHHYAPTRLLDWCSSIYVAAYFATISQIKNDGAIWFIHIHTTSQKMIELHGQEDYLGNDKLIKKGYQSSAAPDTVYFVGKLNKSQRVIAQRGNFSLSRNIFTDHGEIFKECIKDDSRENLFGKLIIPKELKPVFIEKLRTMNISANSLFPGIDGLGKSINELLML